MSLTNPNKVVTEERLNQYHNTILPYLGGMPDILANKFSKSDLYSTDEKIIGRWTDGKPLYQKTIQVSTATIPAWTRYTISTSSLLDNDNIFVVDLCGGYYADFDGSAKQYHFWGGQDITGNSINNMYGYNAHYRQKDKVIAINGSWGGYQYTITNLTFHFRYTKLTDSAVEIGDDTDYSTTEKIIGTWIDGKPIYQKTYDFGTNTPVPAATQSGSAPGTLVMSGFTSIDKLITTKAMSNGGNCWFIDAYPENATGTITLTNYDSVVKNVRYVTVQYTKTTD